MKFKKGVFFSMDALIALSIMIIGTLILFPILDINNQDRFIQSDIVNSLSSLQMGEINNSVVDNLFAQGLIDNPNKSVLEQIGEFYVTNKTIAKELSESIFEGINTDENFGIWFGDELIASKNTSAFENAQRIVVERQVISGISEGESVTAFSGRAFLSEGLRSEYFYFGGYVGEGNVSAEIEYDGNINSAEIELAIEDNFNLFVNGNDEGSFSGSGSQTIPVYYTLPTNNFNPGVNLIELKGDNLHISGGFIKILYEPNLSYQQDTKYKFPGIKGIINLYDGFYIPGELQSMEIYLHYFGDLNASLNIGNVTVYNGSEENEAIITRTDAELSSLLNYDELVGKTIPLRFGFEGVNYTINQSQNSDTFSVTDISGSMNWQCSNTSQSICQNSQNSCTSAPCLGVWSSFSPLYYA